MRNRSSDSIRSESLPVPICDNMSTYLNMYFVQLTTLDVYVRKLL